MIENEFQLKYLGERDYIDASQIVGRFFEYCRGRIDPYEIADIRLRIRHPITRQPLLLRRIAGEAEDPRSVAALSYVHLGQPVHYFLLETDRIIRDREPEPFVDLNRDLLLRDGSVRVARAFSDNSVYVLMRMGKHLIQSLGIHDSPRVVSCRFARPPRPEEIPRLSTSLESTKPRMGFLTLRSDLDGAPIGNVVVHLK